MTDLDSELKVADLTQLGEVKLSLLRLNHVQKGVLILQTSLGEYYLAQVIYCPEVIKFTLPILKMNGEIIATYADDLLKLDNDDPTVLDTLNSILNYHISTNSNSSSVLIWKKKT